MLVYSIFEFRVKKCPDPRPSPMLNSMFGLDTLDANITIELPRTALYIINIVRLIDDNSPDLATKSISIDLNSDLEVEVLL